jgi:hypothetical protein
VNLAKKEPVEYTSLAICKSSVLGCYMQGACRCTLADFHCLDLKCELQDTKHMVIEWYLQDAWKCTLQTKCICEDSLISLLNTPQVYIVNNTIIKEEYRIERMITA